MIKLATAEEISSHLASRGVHVDVDPDIPAYIADQDGLTMLFTVRDVGHAAECHIAIPKESVMKSRGLVVEGLGFVKFLGFSRVITSLEGKHKTTHNMLMKLGFTHIGCYNGENIYERIL